MPSGPGPVVQRPRTPAFQAGNAGSNPVGASTRSPSVAENPFRTCPNDWRTRPPRHPIVGRYLSPGLPAGRSPKMGHEPFRDLLLARHSRVPFTRRTATITTDHSPLRPNQGGRIRHRHITDTSPEPAVTDHINRPAMKTRRRQRRHNRHFQQAIYQLGPDHLHIRQTNRNFEPITPPHRKP